MIRSRAAAVLAGIMLAAAPLQGQVLRRLSGGLSAGSAHLTTTATAATTLATLSGSIVGGNAALRISRLRLEGSYFQGNLTVDSGTAGSRDVIDGWAALMIQPVSFFAAGAGYHLRTYVAPAGSSQLKIVDLRLRVEAPLIQGLVRAHAAGWTSASASTDGGVGITSALAGQAGLTLSLPRSPVWGRVMYAIDHTKYDDGGEETFEGLTFAVGIGGR